MGSLIALAFASSAFSSEDKLSNQSSGSSAIPPSAFTFQMQLPPGIDVTERIRAIPKKKEHQKTEQATEEDNATAVGEAPIRPDDIVQLDIRPGIVRVDERSSGQSKKSPRYYVNGWCAYDDELKGLNVRRARLEGLIFPMNDYHFPELLWAEPKTRQIDPPVKKGEKPMHLYKDGDSILEVDAATGRPVRYQDGESEWTYLYKENSAPIVIPEKIATALGRVLAKRKR